MTKVSTTAVAKIAAVATGLAMAVSLFALAPSARAAALTDSQIQSILSLLTSFGADATTIANVQASLTGGTPTTGGSTSSGACYTFTTDLTIGSTGADVTALQTALVAKGHLVMPAGVAMGYFGSLTQSAVAKWQASVGVSPAAGYFGPVSRAAYASSCTTTTPTTPGTPTTPSDLKGGAGDITVTERSSGVEDEVMEGEEEVNVLGFEVEADGSDVEITSVKVSFEHTGSGSDRLDRYVDEVLVMMGDKVIGSADADEFSESNDIYSESIAVSAIVREDDEERFYIAVSAVNNIDSSDLGEDWDVTLDQTRFRDAMGAILTDTTGSITETFTFEDLSTSGDVELTVREDDDSVNEAHVVQVDESSDTNDVEILSFTIEAEGSDMELNSIAFDITASGAGVTEIANDFRLMMGNEEVGRATIDAPASGATGFASNTDTTRTITITDLDDDDVVIDEGDEVSFTLVADINDIDGAFSNGDTLSVSLDSSDVDADDENGDQVTDLNGSAESEDIEFAATGINVKVVSTSAVSTTVDSTDNDYATYKVVVDVTAFDEDAFFATTSSAYTFQIENASTGVVLGTSTATTSIVSSTATLSGNAYRVNEGATKQFTFTVTLDPLPANEGASYRMQLLTINFGSSAGTTGASSWTAAPLSDFRTDGVLIND